MIKTIVTKHLRSALVEQGVSVEHLRLDTPKHADHGDLASNIAFPLAKELKKSPKLIAEELCVSLSKSPHLKGISLSPLNGFINLRYSDQWLWKYVRHMFDQKPEFPSQKKKTLLEFVSANPTGPLHIGHGRMAVIGSVIFNLLDYIGEDVQSEHYTNDAGNQIKNFRASVEAAKNGDPIPEDGYHGDYVGKLAKMDVDPVSEILSQQKHTLQKVGIEFDHWFSELTLHESKVTDTLEALKKADLAYTQDGALWFRSSQYGDDKDRVLIKADGAYTYFAVDIAYHYDKVQRGYQRLINVWGADHHGYIQRLKAAVSAIGHDANVELDIVIGQLVSLFKDGKPLRMSKRTGDMITFDEVIDEIGSDASRFFLIQKTSDTHLDFDLDLAKEQSSNNPVFYVQYAHARICSILRKVGKTSIDFPETVSLDAAERDTLLAIVKIYDEIYDAAINFQGHKVAQYAQFLAKTFHRFYEKCPILKASPEDQTKRLAILEQTRTALHTCFDILGISAPETM